MNHERSGKGPFEDLSRPAKAAWGVLAGGVAIMAIWFSNNSGKVQDIDPIRIPANADRVDKDNSLVKTFRVNKSQADAVFCGKVSLRFQPDYDVPKTISIESDGSALVECDTMQYDVPVKRISSR